MAEIDEIEIKFAKSFKEYLENQPRGTIAKIAKELKVKPGSVSNWANGQRKSTETQRRKIAEQIGIQYETMIGIENSSQLEPEFEKKIEQFEDKEECLKAITNLREIEELDETSFIRMVAEIKATARKLQKRKQENKPLSKLKIEDNSRSNEIVEPTF